jgi:thioredoxin-like negative regulator of GroEL
MRREILFSLVGFLGGFVIAAAVFWEPAGKTAKVGETAAAAPVAREPKHESAGADANGQGRRPIVVAVGESEGASQIQPAVAEVKAPAEIFHEVIGTLKGLDPNKRQAVIEDLVKKLRAAGPEGLKVLRDYFRAGQDVKFQNGYAKVNGQFVATPSLRAALITSLGGWDGPEAVELTREILRTTPRMSEASLAIAQLETRAPGAYRAEAIQTLQELATSSDDKESWMMGNNGLFDAIKQFKATELLPAAEAAVEKNPWSVQQYIAVLGTLPADVRSSALQRLFANETISKSMTSNPYALQSMNYSEPVVAQNVARLFEASKDKRFRENFLTNFANTGGFANFGTAVAGGGNVAKESTADRVARLQTRLSFLEQIRPYANTPVLQERWQDAATDLQKAIANPEKAQTGTMRVQVGGGAGTLIMNGSGDGTAIQILQTNPGK